MNSQVILICVLVFISWVLRAYGAVQEQRDPIDKPLIWGSNVASLFLALLWIVPLLVGIYLSYQQGGFVGVLLVFAVYFVLLPILLGKAVKSIMSRLHI